MSKDWYKIKILGKEVNWASVIASGVIFLALEMYRRKNLSKQVKTEVKKSVEKLVFDCFLIEIWKDLGAKID